MGIFNNLNIIYFFSVILLITSCTPSPNRSHNRSKRYIDENLDKTQFNFDCKDRPVGFYADIDYNCQIFHMCDKEHNRIPHICANETSFNQEYRICDWDYNFNCNHAEKWFYLNDLTYATDPPNDDRSGGGVYINVSDYDYE